MVILRSVNRHLLLIVPLLSGILALRTGYLPFKVCVPGCCGLILALELPRLSPALRKQVCAVIWAFGMSMVGDSFLSNRNGHAHFFEAGIGAFFLAHVGYLGYALMNGRLHRLGLIAMLVVFLPFYGLCLAPGIRNGVLSGAVLLYLLISCVAFAAALGLKQEGLIKGFYVAGIALVVFSDTIISLSEFLHYRHLNWLILPTYYLAHVTITLGMQTRFRAKSGE